MSWFKNNLNNLWSYLIVEECVRLGVEYFLLAPGSRCAPLTVAVARNKKAKNLKCFDERSLGFCALGIARATRKPVVIIVTSGTAVANLMPAIVEASLDRIPLLIITADRPFYLRTIGANQTIDQVKFFGDYVREYIELSVPSDKTPARALLGLLDQAYFKTVEPYPGPVHINFQLDEPLEPDFIAEFAGNYLAELSDWFDNERPYCQNYYPNNELNLVQQNKIAEVINRAENGIIVVGAINKPAELECILALARKLNWPVLPDVSSGLRFYNDRQIVANYDILLQQKKFNSIIPDVVLQFGGRLTSKSLLQFLRKNSPVNYVLVNNNFAKFDPNNLINLHVTVDITLFCQSLELQVKASKSFNNKLWFSADKQLDSLLDKALVESNDKICEPWVARKISQLTDWSNHALFLSSSMPIRDMSMFASPQENIPDVGVNRGASGIDGIISSAIGFSVGLKKPLILLIGDLAFLHDTNGLSLLSQAILPLVIVLVNNSGGGIFSFLPIAKSADVFSEFFTTPHDYNLENISRTFNIEHTKVVSKMAFTNAYQSALISGKHQVIEVLSDVRFNYEMHEYINQQIKENL
ncbi:MAG: 2-succinyl-5-enolpyruvyl-6-hydroxy-3-cyclohexene-1-carboxylic-acid synthase [bacterium]|nr:2-succinyl-5-enolpyruvyl-6-hydroxy-3-cyclohexene-1-carboxylic-acid synthase [bacterium]